VSNRVLTNVNRWLPRATFVGALCASVLACCPIFAADPYGEEEVEAAFLYRFAGYVEWPPEALSSPEFTIAVLGDDTIVQELQRILPQHQLKNHPAQVRRIRRIEELGESQMLFVGPQYNDELRSVIARIPDRPVLVVTASDHGLDAGSCVNFLFIDRRVRFEVSTTAAEHVGLKISAELLSVAVRVQGRGAR
jgi:YfiR/HmsC-like